MYNDLVKWVNDFRNEYKEQNLSVTIWDYIIFATDIFLGLPVVVVNTYTCAGTSLFSFLQYYHLFSTTSFVLLIAIGLAFVKLENYLAMEIV